LARSLEKLFLLCECLSPRPKDGQIEALGDRLSGDEALWQAIIRLATGAFLGPALWVALGQKGLRDSLPDDAADFLRDSFELNEQRNQNIRAEAVALLSASNKAGLVPLLLKGGGHLFLPGSRLIQGRMMGDLDFVAETGTVEQLAQVFQDMGYEVTREQEPWSHSYLHLRRKDAIAPIDLHRDVGKQRHALPIAEAFSAADLIHHDDVTLRLLMPTHQVLFNVFHAAVQDRTYQLGRLPLRALRDLSCLAEEYGSEIDWEFVRDSMYENAYGQAFDAYLYQAHRLFGFPAPPGLTFSWRPRLHFKWCLLVRRRRFLRRVIEIWATVTHPFERAHFEYAYGHSSGFLNLQMRRARLGWSILVKHKGGLFQKFIKEYHNIYRSS